jgi:hypothetical protein
MRMRRRLRLMASVNVESMRDRVEFLSTWEPFC